jgi:hypothetical protein
MNRRLLRSEISHRNLARAREWAAETTYSSLPSVIYGETESGEHGNFLPAVYRRILSNDQWRERLRKVYTGSRFLPSSGDRKRLELDCANSSDALLMNIFCYPAILRRKAFCSLLNVEAGATAEFGFRAAIPLKSGKTDRTEIDLRLNHLLIEGKLTEGGFQNARPDLVLRYRDLEQVFDVALLPMQDGRFRSYQLIRGALAAFALEGSFCVLCDRRRPDLIEDCFRVFSAAHSADLRCRLSLLTWQEIAAALPPTLKAFLNSKYGITSPSIRGPNLRKAKSNEEDRD